MPNDHSLLFKKKSSRYTTFQLGGLTIGVENSVWPSLLREDPAEHVSFLCSSNCLEADVQICMEMESVYEKSVTPSAIVFSDKYYRINEVSNGFQVLRYGVQQQQRPYLTIQADRNFSNFIYSFHIPSCCSEKKQTIFPAVSALDALLLKHTVINHQGLIIHAAGGAIQGKGMVFSAHSGIGKSTICRLLSQSQGNILFSEERIIIRSHEIGWKVWGTPWHGESKIALNESAPFAALIFLRQAQETAITRLHPSDALRRLLQTTSIPWYNEEWMSKGLAVCETLLQNIPVFELAFRPDRSAVQAVERLAGEL
ncbi:hypothetical protein H206_00543 [Candidatus Electrothrix aarhusensis]|uniref:Hpr(Ser) kinase/phosphatase n=1 Tax=Candidatus Electrothrix aarhusensis TaxID=1859131 RepID=A0A444J2Q6_9BACT|nr:hypothetical protein H206_00543 [Candidatus Electrothrix aarhusensis]